MSKNVFRFGQQLIESGSSWIFAPVSWAWGFVVHTKNRLYRWGVFKPKRVSRPVVSIGNIVAGGTGKTPLIHLLSMELAHRKIAILSRGYGPVPDEPILLQRRLPKAKVYVGKDRVRLAKKAIKEGAELLLLDDGFQHRRLHRDLDWVVLDAEDPWGKGHYLPWGYLRDSPRRVKDADALFMNGERSDFPYAICFRLCVQRIVDLKGREKTVERGDPVGIFCGIGAPRRFQKTVWDLGARSVHEWILADHQVARRKQLERFALESKERGAKYLLTTEKDAVKLPEHLSLCLPVYYLEMQAEITTGKNRWKLWVEKIDQIVDHRPQ